MPGMRRPLTRLQTTPPPSIVVNKITGQRPSDGSSNSSIAAEEKEGFNVSTASVLPPKHTHLPDIPVDGNFTFEAMIFVFSVIALGLQYINLYKTVWWLPHSHAKFALHFYLIDPYLVMFLVALMSRRMLWCFFKETYSKKAGRSCLYWFIQLVKLLVIGSVFCAFSFAAYHVVIKYTFLSLFLCYPLVTYAILFGIRSQPFFGKSIVHVTSGLEKGTPKHKAREIISIKEAYIHNCTTSPEAIRDEVDTLKTDFNNRIKQVLFNSMLVAYYMAFIPLCFAQNTLYYDTWWVGQHVVLVWIAAFVMYMLHFLPARYVDVLHRCSLHLGRWVKVEGRHAHVPYNAWSELTTWQHGVLVKHVKGLFKAEGINNAAEPGNSMHSRFYFMFNQPVRVTNWLLIMTIVLVAYEFIQLVQSSEWSHILSLALLLINNYYILFKLMRDRMVLCRAYKDDL